MTQHYILTDLDVAAIGGDPVTNPEIPTMDRLAIRPSRLTAGGFALSETAAASATEEQRNYLAANCAMRDVALEEFQWFAESNEGGGE